MLTTREIPGCETLIEGLDRAIGGETGVPAITHAVQDLLSELILGGAVHLPAEVCRPVTGHYARRLVHRSDDLGYVVVAMIWGPGQATPLHDHAGTWCVEGVYRGEIEVTRFDLVESEGERCRFERHESVWSGVGAAGSLIPPYEYHSIANPAAESSITLHVYGGDLLQCTAFEPLGGDWYRRSRRELTYDS